MMPPRWRNSFLTERPNRQKMVRLEEGAAVMAAVRDLLSPYERAVILHWLDGMSFQEIADACGTHLKSFDNALWRVKCKLRRHFLREAAATDHRPGVVPRVERSSAMVRAAHR